MQLDCVWIFVGGGTFPSGVFSTREIAESWIQSNTLSGTLTRYPIDVGVYEWAIERGVFEPKQPHQFSPSFIGRFSSASMEHFHYENGTLAS